MPVDPRPRQAPRRGNLLGASRVSGRFYMDVVIHWARARRIYRF